MNLREKVVSNFDAANWEEIGLLTGHSKVIDNHPRLLRSLYWGDEDYAGNVLVVLSEIAKKNLAAIAVIEDYVKNQFPEESVFISAKPSERKITFAPSVFSTPDSNVESDLVAVMMPFGAEFSPVHRAIVAASNEVGRRCLRVDDIWEESTIIQDVFNLIFRAHVVVVDFSGKNPNVMYETGIAHTLGKHVIPISQSLDDVPFDIKHHRVLKYLPNAEGMQALQSALAVKLRQVSP
ncbi:hypothetical protein [Pseudoxanthomonas sp. OG2]|uniref:hypothetical protein n=1 Tax=Pseudoxanthomonas sp. OG2 TaxID=2587011 RepID=UPI00161BC0B9